MEEEEEDADDADVESAEDNGDRENFCENQDRIPEDWSSGGTKFSRLDEEALEDDLLR